jgi:Uma2 family endonuclease
MVIPTRLYTVAEFEQFIAQPENRDGLFELINGEIVEKMPTEEHGMIAAIIVAALVNYKRQHKSRGYPGVEVRHQFPGDQDNSFLPDVSFRFTDEVPVTKGAVPRMPDVAVEIQSENNSLRSLREKADYTLQHGSRLVWLILQKRIVLVCTPDDEYILTEDDTLDGEDVLPHFALPVKDIFNFE